MDTDSSRKRVLGFGWLAFAVANLVWLFRAGVEYTIPYHLIWVSFALVYGLYAWSRAVTQTAFWAVTVLTGIPLAREATWGTLAWSECSEIVLMGALVALLVWHVDRHRAVQRRIKQLHEEERIRAHNRDLAARFGSHEIRTRLTVARGYAELIRDSTPEAAIRSDAGVVLNELDKAMGTATNVLTLVRVEGATPRMPVHLDDLIDTVVRRWAATADRAWSTSSAVGFVLADAERLEAALDCLIENAVKFTSAGDRIAVDVRLCDGALRIDVSDSGNGMPTGDLERVLEAFQTGSTAGDRAGSGLGLAIVKAMVEARGGSIHVTSTLGEGSRFSMSVPTVGPSSTELRRATKSGPEEQPYPSHQSSAGIASATDLLRG